MLWHKQKNNSRKDEQTIGRYEIETCITQERNWKKKKRTDRNH